MGQPRPSDPITVTVITAAGPAIGLGHLQRCLTLAGALRGKGVEPRFSLRGDPEAAKRVANAGFPVSLRERSVVSDHVASRSSVFVVDDYAWGADDFSALVALGRPVAVIDDLADRSLAVDLVVNGSAGAGSLAYGPSLHSQLLLGPEYALLRREFATRPNREIPAAVRRVLITVGGSDPLGLSAALVAQARATLPAAILDVVVGPLFDARLRDLLSWLATDETICLHEDPADMRGLMLQADLAVSASGQTLYELAACGTPTVCFLAAENQRMNASSLDARGAVCFVGSPAEPAFLSGLAATLLELSSSIETRQRMSQTAGALVDGRGADRVADAIRLLALSGN